MEIIDRAGGDDFIAPWSLGGGTALMLQIDHRDSHDVDIFLDDPQILGLLNPITSEYDLSIAPSDYTTDGTRSLKIVFSEVGEIDFICCGCITATPTFKKDVEGREIDIETPGEILAKKIHYRGSSFQPRDIFDLVAATRTVGLEEIAASLCEVRNQCAVVKQTIEKMRPEFPAGIMKQLMHIRPRFQDIPEVGRQEALKILEQIVE